MWSEWKTHTLLQIQIKNAENLNIWKGNLGWDVENYEKIFRSEYKWPNWSYTMLFFSELGILFKMIFQNEKFSTFEIHLKQCVPRLGWR